MQVQLASVSSEGFLDGSDAIMHWEVPARVTGPVNVYRPDEDRLCRYGCRTLQMASPAVICLVLVHGHAKAILEMVSFGLMNADDLALLVMAGHSFEHLAHLKLALGGRFQCRLLTEDSPGENFTLTLPRCTAVQYFSSAQQLAGVCQPHLKTYHMPSSLRAASGDSASSAYSASSPAAYYHVRCSPSFLELRVVVPLTRNASIRGLWDAPAMYEGS